MTLPCHTPLSADQQRAAGLDSTWPLALADRVRFAEIDQLKHVNNVAYMVWFETIRIRYFQDWGLTSYSANDPRIVIRRAEIDYLAELHMDADYITTIRCTATRTTSFTLNSELWSAGTKRATFSCVVVLLTPDGSARLPIPEQVRQRFDQIDLA